MTTTTEAFDQPRWGTVREAAAEWHVSLEAVRRWAAQGLVPSRRIGRSYQIDLNALDRTRRGADIGPPPRIDRRELYARQRALAESATRLRDRSRELIEALTQWAGRDDAEIQPGIRQAASTATDAIGAMQAELKAVSARLRREIRQADDAGEPRRGAA